MANDVFKDANTLLIYAMPTPAKVPDGDLWERVMDNPGLSTLARYEAWYCSKLPGEKELRGRLAVDRNLRPAFSRE